MSAMDARGAVDKLEQRQIVQRADLAERPVVTEAAGSVGRRCIRRRRRCRVHRRVQGQSSCKNSLGAGRAIGRQYGPDKRDATAQKGAELPLKAVREQIASAFDLVVHQSRFRDGSRHITHVTEVVGMEGDVVTLQDIFLFDYNAGYDENGAPRGTLKSTGLRPKFLDKLAAHGMHVDPSIFAFERFGG